MVNFNFDKCARILKLKKPPVEKKVVSGNPAPSKKERCLSDFKTVNISTGDCFFSSYDIINFAPSSSVPAESDYIPYAKFVAPNTSMPSGSGLSNYLLIGSQVHKSGTVSYPELILKNSTAAPWLDEGWTQIFDPYYTTFPYGSTMGIADRLGNYFYIGYAGTMHRYSTTTFGGYTSVAGFNTFYDALSNDIVCQDIGTPWSGSGVFGVCPSHTGPIFVKHSSLSPNDYIIDAVECFSGADIGKCSISFKGGLTSAVGPHYPVVCYNDISNSKIKYAISTVTSPASSGDWNIYNAISYTPSGDNHALAKILYINSISSYPVIIWQDYGTKEFKCSIGNISEPLIEGDWTTHTICTETEMLYTPSFDAAFTEEKIYITYLTLDGKIKLTFSSTLSPTSSSDWTTCEIIDDEISYLTVGNTNRTSILTYGDGLIINDVLIFASTLRQGTLGDSNRRNKLKVSYMYV